MKPIKKGNYSDQEVILMMNKVMKSLIPLQLRPNLTIYSFKMMGRKIQEVLKERSLSESALYDLMIDYFVNPPKPPENEVENPVKEEKKKEEPLIIKSELNEKGKEVITFSKIGMVKLHRGDLSDFEEVGQDQINGHEDDGRIYKTRRIKRLADGKNFSYDYIWHAEWDDDFWSHSITEE